MLIDNGSLYNYIQISTINNSINNIFLDLDKHYPFFKIFDISNLCPEKYVYNINYFVTDNKSFRYALENHSKQIDYKEFNKNILPIFLDDHRTTNMFSENSSNYYRFKDRLVQLCHWTNLKYFNNYSTKITYSTYTLGINDKLLYCLCIKPEYVYYVKLCYLTKQDVEFDCFYILARTNGNKIINDTTCKKFYTVITKAIKYFGCEVRYVDSIEAEIGKTVNLPKFNTVKDYNNWLNNIKDGFIATITKDLSKNSIHKPVDNPF